MTRKGLVFFNRCVSFLRGADLKFTLHLNPPNRRFRLHNPYITFISSAIKPYSRT